ncbi:MAG: hypothetical protein K6E18_01005 [Lachnospiraceae bacterium]|nr:hypothetical protein [Lachnospiraceae bacterium]
MDQAKDRILRQIAGIKHRLWVKQLLETAASGLLAGAGVAALLALFSVFRPVAYLYWWEGAILAAGVLTGMLAGAFRLPTDLDAAKRIDAFGLKERIVTALEFQDRDDALSRMQREDALQALRAKKDEIRIVVFAGYKTLLLAAGMVGIAVALSMIPSPAKEQAQDREKAQLLVKETQKEIKKAEEALGQIPEGELSEEQKKQLQEMRELLAESKASLGKVKTPEQAGKESAKAEYNFAEMSKQLVLMAQEGTGAGARDLEKAAQQIDDQAAGQMAQNENGEDGQKPGENPGENGDPGSGQSGAGSSQDPSGDQNGQSDGQKDQNSGSGNENPGNENGGSENSGNENSGNQTGENGGSENGENSGGRKENGSGEEGPGDQNGNGPGEGTGEGNENGNGRGGNGSDEGGSEGGDHNGGGDGQGGSGQSDFGSATEQHDYVSIPKKTGDDENLTGKNRGSGDVDIYRQQNGLSWEGEHVDGQAVIGEYARKAYDGISRGEYPEGMEDVIKQYFNGF